MARKPNSMYRQVKGPAYTRREYMGGIPASRITQFDLGNKKDIGLTKQVTLSVKESCQVRHTSLEAARIACNRYVSKRLGSQNYHLKVRVYPHHILRENKQATGAGADRVSQGMRKAFGKNVGTAARLKRGQKIMTIYCTPEGIESAKAGLKKASQKLPSPTELVVEDFEPAIKVEVEEN